MKWMLLKIRVLCAIKVSIAKWYVVIPNKPKIGLRFQSSILQFKYDLRSIQVNSNFSTKYGMYCNHQSFCKILHAEEIMFQNLAHQAMWVKNSHNSAELTENNYSVCGCAFCYSYFSVHVSCFNMKPALHFK